MIEYNKELGKPCSKISLYLCFVRLSNGTRNQGNKTCFSDTVNNNEADKNNDSDYTEVVTNDCIIPAKPLFDSVFDNDGNDQLSANSDDSWEKNKAEVLKITVNKLIFSN